MCFICCLVGAEGGREDGDWGLVTARRASFFRFFFTRNGLGVCCLSVFLSVCLTVGTNERTNERMTGRKRERKMEREKKTAVTYIHKLVLVS